MATYCIGDLHGCYNEFMKMLDQIKFDDHKDELLLTGDLIGRGPHPLETLNQLMSMQHCVHAVLGNHDLNFLAVCAGIVKAKPKDNLDPVLNAPNLGEILKFYYALPFLYLDDTNKIALCHAGIFPSWELNVAEKMSKELSKVLRNPLRRDLLLRNMYKDFPVTFEDDNQGLARWRFSINVFTRMRLCDKNLNLDYGHSSTSVENAAKEGLYPWFNFGNPTRYKKKQYTLVFGHWAALNGKCTKSNIKALDTGCVWGDALSCWIVSSDKILRVKSEGHLAPKEK